jgi:hypothetical protein
VLHVWIVHCRIPISRIHSDALLCAVFVMRPRVAQASPAGAIMANRPRVSNGRGGTADSLQLTADGFRCAVYGYGSRATACGLGLALELSRRLSCDAVGLFGLPVNLQSRICNLKCLRMGGMSNRRGLSPLRGKTRFIQMNRGVWPLVQASRTRFGDWGLGARDWPEAVGCQLATACFFWLISPSDGDGSRLASMAGAVAAR